MKKNKENIGNLKVGLVGVIAGKMAGKKGFTLIEVLAAMAILSIGLVSLMSLSVTSLKSKETGKRRTIAVNLAADKIEYLRAIPYHNVNIDGAEAVERKCENFDGATRYECEAYGGSTYIEYFGNLRFDWRWDVLYIDLDNDGVTHQEGSTYNIEDDDVKLITVYVTWTDMFGDHEVSLKTLRYRLG